MGFFHRSVLPLRQGLRCAAALTTGIVVADDRRATNSQCLGSWSADRAAAAKSSAPALPSAWTTSREIIPRSVLFGNPEYAAPALSPDGAHLAFLRPDANNVLNVWVRSAAGVSSGVTVSTDRVVTCDTYRGIRQFFWAEDSATLLFLQDDGGDENFHLWAIDATTPGARARDLTPFQGVKAQNVITNKRCARASSRHQRN